MLRSLALGLLLVSSLKADPSTLEKRIAEKLKGFPASVTLYAKNLNTGVSFSRQGDEPVRTASTIKLPIMIECYSEASQQKLDLE